MSKAADLGSFADAKSDAFWEAPLENLPLRDQTFRLIWQCEAEVNNGGFDQYFLNSSGDDAFAAPAAFKRIGASVTAEIVATAFAELGDGRWTNRDARHARLMALDDAASERLLALDDRFYEYADPLEDLLHAYVFGRQTD